MDAKVEEKVLSECGFVLTARKTHATAVKRLNLVINPEDYVYIKDYECKKIHYSSFTVFPKEINNGEKEIHYGYKLEFDDSLSMKQFLMNYIKFKENIYRSA